MIYDLLNIFRRGLQGTYILKGADEAGGWFLRHCVGP